MTQPHPLPDEVRVELERVVRRWQQLPLDHALRACEPVRELAQRLADETAQAQGLPVALLPDLGPGTLVHQLQVCTYDAARQRSVRGRAVGIPELVDDLIRVRRQIG